MKLRQFSQERIVLALAVILFLVFSLTLPHFIDPKNLLTLLRNVAVLGILGLAMVIAVIGRGIDLSLVANMTISVAWSFALANAGVNLWLAIMLGLGFALLMGLISGLLIAYAEISPLFATLAMGIFIYGLGRSQLIEGTDVVYLSQHISWLKYLGQGNLFGIPSEVLIALAVALIMFVLLRYTKIGRFIYAMGDNFAAARIAGMPVRVILVFQYVVSGSLAFLAGIITATSISEINTRIVSSNLIYDVILVVVLGGVSLSGGKGGVRNVLVGTLLIGILMSGMTIMNLQDTVQDLIKGLILLAALIIDSLINPRDEQTAQQGDI